MSKRDLKFRVYDDEDLGMCPADSIFWHEGTQWVSWCSGTCEAMVSDISVMQFTNLHDSDGVDLYEGDIIHDPDFPDTSHLQIGFEYGAFACLKMNGDYEMDGVEIDNNCIKIGNVHENPELLTD